MYLLCNRNTYDKLINLAADMGDFGKNYGKKHLMSEELKSAKLFWLWLQPLPQPSLSATKQIKTFFRNTTTRKRLNHHIIIHVLYRNIAQPNAAEVAWYFKDGNHGRLQVFGRF